ncbi:roadblock/LC7 domain-containing protein [Microtetraspora sp. AC03309]|uniref:roadblock/LC7 domain-containing protein n=1 Tax=Microtetraspora sp. AC03309 TaxID=2779376 RepID=UPI001E43A48E|nr:roadblock/LC7 domain-containing protein [Microtetraspora sp. AC03309]MCC5574643.1 roadblock/LC7 domain-containing protein [Microtetraspora sp. AC03309]
MTAPGIEGLPPDQRVHAELRDLRTQMGGVHGSMVAASDGFLISCDIPELEPTRIAALIAATLGLARQATQATGRGRFREAVARGSDGYLAVFAVGDDAVLAVIGTDDLNIGMLHYQIRDLIKRITSHLAQFEWGWQGSMRPDAAADGLSSP